MSFRYKEYGDHNAPLIMFVHGGGVSGWMWDQQIRYFTHYHCVVPDLPEHALGNDKIIFSIKGSAEQFIPFVEKIARGKSIILIGFSLGSQVIIQMLSLKPNVADFVIINSALVRPNSLARILVKPFVQLSHPLIKSRRFAKLQAKTLHISGENFEKYYEESRQIKLDTIVRVLEENMSFGIPEGFNEATGKILVTAGEKEKSVMINSVKDIVKANPNCTGVVIPDVGHGFPLAEPDAFNQMVETWIRDGSVPNKYRLIRA